MAGPASEIPALLRLLDDENPAVRRAVQARLVALGPGIEQLLRQYAPEELAVWIPAALRLRLDGLHHGLVSAWADWLAMPSSTGKLERGLVLLARYLSGSGGASLDIEGQLDALAADWALVHPWADFRGLADYLFGSGRFRGNEADYYAPQNSDLAWVLREGKGNPILLACVMILVGARRGVAVSGCNFPSHFLARHEAIAEGALYLIDCFNGGKILPAAVLMQHAPWDSPDVQEVVRIPASAEIIISRVLRNLDLAFERAGKTEEQGFVRELLYAMSRRG